MRVLLVPMPTDRERLARDLGHRSSLQLVAAEWSRLQLLKSYGGGEWLALLVR